MPAWRQFDELDRWRREVDQRLAAMCHGAPTGGSASGYIPALESFISGDHLTIRVELPGLERTDVELTVLGNVLSIKGERKDSRNGHKGDYLHREIPYGSFERRLTLPRAADADKIKASF